MTQAVVLAGGLATRLGDITHGTPKYLLPVAGRPFAAWQLERLRQCGFDRVVLCVGHLAQQIRETLGDVHDGVNIDYADDGPVPLGTGGALRNALGLLEPTFVVTYGDSYLPFDYGAVLRDLEQHEQAMGTMAVYKNEGRFDRSNTRVEGELVVEYDKELSDAHFIDYGATALRRRAVQTLVEGPSDLGRLQAALAAARHLRAHTVHERFYEIGSPSGLQELAAYLSGGSS